MTKKTVVNSIGTLILMLSVSPLWGEELVVPKEVFGREAEFIRVPALTKFKNLVWFSPDDGLSVFPVDLLKDSKTAVVTASKPGRYRLYCFGALSDKPSGPAVCVVVIGQPEPNPPGPNPGPGPKPPEPKPDDDLTKSLREAFAREPAATREQYRSAFAKVLREAPVDDPNLRTVYDLFMKLNQARRASGIPDDGFLEVRKAIQTELDKTLPRTVETELDYVTRKQIKESFTKAVAALEAIK